MTWLDSERQLGVWLLGAAAGMYFPQYAHGPASVETCFTITYVVVAMFLLTHRLVNRWLE